MLSKQIAANSALSGGSRIIGNIISLVIVGLIARTLSPAEVGDYFTIIALLYTFSFFADLGLYSLLVRDISRPDVTGPEESRIVSTAFSLRVGALVVALAAAIVAGFLFPYSNIVRLGIVIGTLHIFFLSASQVLMGVFQKYLKLGRVAVAELIGRVVQLGMVWAVVQYGWMDGGLLGLIAALIAAAGISFVLNVVGAHKLVPFRFRVDVSAWMATARTALPLGTAVIITALYFRLSTLLLSVYSGPEAVGIYNIGYRVLEALIFFPAMFVGLVMPQLSNYAVADRKRFQALFQKTLHVLLFLVVPVVIGLIMRARDIVVLLGGEQYAASALALQILSGAIAMIFIGALLANAMIALNKQKLLAWVYGGGLVCNIIVNVLVIRQYSYIGASWATFSTEALVTVLMAIVLVRQAVSVWPRLTSAFQIAAGGGVMSATLALTRDVHILVVIPIAAIAYIAGLFVTGGLRKELWRF